MAEIDKNEKSNLHKVLTKAGFTADDELLQVELEAANQADMDRGGTYTLIGLYTRGTTSIKIERNVDTREEGGMESSTKYRPVVIISGARGGVACDAEDADFVLRMAEDLS